jgi:hypothetical protein
MKESLTQGTRSSQGEARIFLHFAFLANFARDLLSSPSASGAYVQSANVIAPARSILLVTCHPSPLHGAPHLPSARIRLFLYPYAA